MLLHRLAPPVQIELQPLRRGTGAAKGRSAVVAGWRGAARRAGFEAGGGVRCGWQRPGFRRSADSGPPPPRRPPRPRSPATLPPSPPRAPAGPRRDQWRWREVAGGRGKSRDVVGRRGTSWEVVGGRGRSREGACCLLVCRELLATPEGARAQRALRLAQKVARLAVVQAAHALGPPGGTGGGRGGGGGGTGGDGGTGGGSNADGGGGARPPRVAPCVAWSASASARMPQRS